MLAVKSTGNYFVCSYLHRTAVSGAPGMVLPGYHPANLAMHAYPYMLAGQYMMPQVGEYPQSCDLTVTSLTHVVATSGWF